MLIRITLWIGLCLVLSGVSPASAKTRTRTQAIESQTLCQFRAKFLAARTEAVSPRGNRGQAPQYLVFWDVEVLDSSSDPNCPARGPLSIRVRSASASISPTNTTPTFAYVTGSEAPPANTTFSLTARLLRGRDDYFDRTYEEWTLGEVKND